MNKQLVVIAVLLLLVTGLVAAAEVKVVGVLEFDEKTTIGQENASIIVPEILVTYLKSIGKYQLAERILLKTVLEEQELQMSDITSAETAVKVGEIFNLEGILVGSMMKVGELITINARIIDVQSGEIAASGIVEFERLNQLKSKVEYLAFQLSGYSQSEYRRAVRDRELARNRLGARLGVGTNIAYNQQFRLVDLGVFYHNRFVEAELILAPPFGVDGSGVNNSAGGGVGLSALYYPITHLGIGSGLSFNEVTEGDSGEYVNLLVVPLALTYRANQNFRFAVLVGTVCWAPENDYGSYVPFQFKIKSYVRFTAEYFFYKDLSLHAAIHTTSARLVEKATGLEGELVHTYFFTLGLGYRFSF